MEDIEAFEAGQLKGGACDCACTNNDDLIVAMLEQRAR